MKLIKPVLSIYFFLWMVALIALAVLTRDSGRSFSQPSTFLLEVLHSTRFQLFFHSVFAGVTALFLGIRYYVRLYRNRGIQTALRKLAWYVVVPVAVVCGSTRAVIYRNSTEAYPYEWNHAVENKGNQVVGRYLIDQKHRGITVFGGYRNQGTDELEKAAGDLLKTNAECIALVPFINQRSEDSGIQPIESTAGQYSRRDSALRNQIHFLTQKGFHIYLTPHIWVSDGWRGTIHFDSAEGWDSWFDAYEKYILFYAQIAETTGVDLFGIGTELLPAVKARPDRWHLLIAKVRSVYKGKITYAANWDDAFTDIPFWHELDYIGVQAYFPLTTRHAPAVADVAAGWQKHCAALKKLSDSYGGKPILFTEVGYKSTANAANQPWEWGNFFSILTTQKSLRTQQNAYEALFQSVWHQPWFAGMYVWEWNTRSTPEGMQDDLGFSPRFKPAENTITRWYGQGTPAAPEGRPGRENKKSIPQREDGFP